MPTQRTAAVSGIVVAVITGLTDIQKSVAAPTFYAVLAFVITMITGLDLTIRAPIRFLFTRFRTFDDAVTASRCNTRFSWLITFPAFLDLAIHAAAVRWRFAFVTSLTAIQESVAAGSGFTRRTRLQAMIARLYFAAITAAVTTDRNAFFLVDSIIAFLTFGNDTVAAGTRHT